MLAVDGADHAVNGRQRHDFNERSEEKGTMAPVYGMASTIPLRGLVSDMLKKYLDLIFKP